MLKEIATPNEEPAGNTTGTGDNSSSASGDEQPEGALGILSEESGGTTLRLENRRNALHKYTINLQKKKQNQQPLEFTPDESAELEEFLQLQRQDNIRAEQMRQSAQVVKEEKEDEIAEKIKAFLAQQEEEDKREAEAAIDYIQQLQRESMLQSPLMATAQRVFADIHTWHPHLRMY